MLSRKKGLYTSIYVKLKLQYIFQTLCFFSLIQIATLTIDPGKNGNKNVHLREKYKGTKFPNESNFIA